MEKTLLLQDRIKNKMKEKIIKNLGNEISEKEEEILNVKEKYEHQDHKEGFFMKSHVQDIKNGDTSKKDFYSLYSFFVLFLIAVGLTISIFIANEETLKKYGFFFAFFTGAAYGLSFCLFFDKLESYFNLKTKLTIKYETLKTELSLLNEKLSYLDFDINAYIDNTLSDNLNEDEIGYIEEMPLSKTELEEITEIFTEEELVHLSFIAISDPDHNNDVDSGIIIKYRHLLYFIDIKKDYDIKDVTNLIFKTSIK